MTSAEGISVDGGMVGGFQGFDEEARALTAEVTVPARHITIWVVTGQVDVWKDILLHVCAADEVFGLVEKEVHGCEIIAGGLDAQDHDVDLAATLIAEEGAVVARLGATLGAEAT